MVHIHIKLRNLFEKLHISEAHKVAVEMSRSCQMRECISTPCIGLKRMLAKFFKIKNIDEFITSCLDNNTFEENVNAVIIKNERSRKLHSAP